MWFSPQNPFPPLYQVLLQRQSSFQTSCEPLKPIWDIEVWQINSEKPSLQGEVSRYATFWLFYRWSRIQGVIARPRNACRGPLLWEDGMGERVISKAAWPQWRNSQVTKPTRLIRWPCHHAHGHRNIPGSDEENMPRQLCTEEMSGWDTFKQTKRLPSAGSWAWPRSQKQNITGQQDQGTLGKRTKDNTTLPPLQHSLAYIIVYYK